MTRRDRAALWLRIAEVRRERGDEQGACSAEANAEMLLSLYDHPVLSKGNY